MRPVHIAGFAQLPHVERDTSHDEAEMVQAVTAMALQDASMTRAQIGFTCSGSNDYVMGRPFSFVLALDGIGPWPPIRESHVEMDGAWALYEAYVRLQHGDVDTALVYAYGKASVGSMEQINALQLDPYYVYPLGIGPTDLAAMQARALLETGRYTERDFAEVVFRNRRSAQDNPNALDVPLTEVDALLASPMVANPLRAHDQSAEADGAACIVLKVGGGGPRIAGIDHRIEAQSLGCRDLTRSRATEIAAAQLDLTGVEVAELHTPYAHQELILREALTLDDDCVINPSGGCFGADAPMVAGLVRLGEAARAIQSGARRAVAHATQGPCLQQNLVAVLEAS